MKLKTTKVGKERMWLIEHGDRVLSDVMRDERGRKYVLMQSKSYGERNIYLPDKLQDRKISKEIS